jgi:hypothetical protein
LGQRQAHREAQRRYRQSLRGREAHRQAERRRRMGKMKKNQKTVDDATSTPRLPRIIFCAHRRGRCRFCGCAGVIVKAFPRRGYGGRPHRRQRSQNGWC